MSNPQDAGPHSREGRPAPGAGNPAGETSLPDKPILEWTEEDWARWIAAPPSAPPASPEPSPPPEDVRAEPEAEPEIWVELDATSEMDVWAEPDTDAVDDAAAADVARPQPSADEEMLEPAGSERPVVGAAEPETEAETDGHVAVDAGEEHGRSDVASIEADRTSADAGATDDVWLPTTTQERDAPWEPGVEPATPEPAVEGPFEVEGPEAEEPSAVAAADEPLPVAAESDGEPATVTAPAAETDEPIAVPDDPLSVAAESPGEPGTVIDDAGEPSAVVEVDGPLPVAAEDAGEPATVSEEAGEPSAVVGPDSDEQPDGPVARAEREWWEAVPPPLPPPSPSSDADGRDEAGTAAAAATRALSGLTDVPPAATTPHPSFAPPRPAPGRTPTRGVPGTGVRPAPPRVQPVVIERSHRVRSALGLLGVAVLVGTIVAGLITVAIFAISVALRRAVG